MGWHELEDWRQAESEIRSKLCFGRTSSDDALIFCDVGGFKEGSVEIWAAPRRLTIRGKPISHEEQAARPYLYRGIVFRIVPLAVETAPARIVTHLRRHFLAIHLPAVRSRQEGLVQAHAG
jgi:HSP20 family molecular chaperone IbpA